MSEGKNYILYQSKKVSYQTNRHACSERKKKNFFFTPRLSGLKRKISFPIGKHKRREMNGC